MNKRICQKGDCTNDAVYGVCLSLKVYENHAPAISTAMVDVCEEHKDVKWEELVTEEGWQKICKGFSSMGKQPPNKKFSKLVLVPVNEAMRISEGGEIVDPTKNN